MMIMAYGFIAQSNLIYQLYAEKIYSPQTGRNPIGMNLTQYANYSDSTSEIYRFLIVLFFSNCRMIQGWCQYHPEAVPIQTEHKRRVVLSQGESRKIVRNHQNSCMGWTRPGVIKCNSGVVRLRVPVVQKNQLHVNSHV